MLFWCIISNEMFGYLENKGGQYSWIRANPKSLTCPVDPRDLNHQYLIQRWSPIITVQTKMAGKKQDYNNKYVSTFTLIYSSFPLLWLIFRATFIRFRRKSSNGKVNIQICREFWLSILGLFVTCFCSQYFKQLQMLDQISLLFLEC